MVEGSFLFPVYGKYDKHAFHLKAMASGLSVLCTIQQSVMRVRVCITGKSKLIVISVCPLVRRASI